MTEIQMKAEKAGLCIEKKDNNIEQNKYEAEIDKIKREIIF